MTALLSVENLHVEFATYGGIVKAVRGVSFDVEAGQTLAIVGESGSGKSVTMQAVMGLIPMPPGKITKGNARLRGQDFLGRTQLGGRTICGDEIGMIFQDPMSSLNPTMRIGDQIAETLKVHRDYAPKDAWRRAVELLELVKIPEAEKRAAQYPFEFSGGMLQRVMIAMAVACEPSVLIADEPTTALDVTIQAQILDLLQDIQRETGMAIILITHDLAVVARMADKVAVMYAGQIVEAATVDELFYESAHPYTLGLKQAMPSAESDENHELKPIPGSPPDLFSPPKGCAYCARCPWHMTVCQTDDPAAFALSETHFSRCWLQHPRQPRQVPGLHRRPVQPSVSDTPEVSQ
jgi:oligopeptide/dipeptide ABC transporter ATP-binding protein